jgi:hypothetical protein
MLGAGGATMQIVGPKPFYYKPLWAFEESGL